MTPSFASSASLLVGLQLGSRLFTFALNQALLRFVSPQAFGTVAIQFELLSSTILFLSREGFRNSLLRAWNSAESKDGKLADVRPSVVNLALLPAAVGIPISVLACLVYHQSCGYETRQQSYFDVAVAIYAIASSLELLSEPFHIRTMGELRTYVRVRAEGVGILVKTGVTFLVILLGERNKCTSALLAFALGQLSYAVVLLLSYITTYGLAPLTFVRLPGLLSNSFDATYLRIGFSMSTQSIFKHILTEGDKFLVSRISPLGDQGGYALANNYGSLIARVLFQPVEEMSRVYFSKTLTESQGDSNAGNAKTAEAELHSASNNSLVSAWQVLSSILSTQLAASTLLCSFAPPFLPLSLQLFLPRRYLSTSAPHLLGAWIYYIPILAVNGVLEAFMSSVATPSDIHRQSRWMAAFSVVFVMATGLFYRLGFQDVSLIYANIVNLLSRIVFAAHFIAAHYNRKGAASIVRWTSLLPHWSFIGLSVTSAIALNTLPLDVTLVRRGGFRALLHTSVLTYVAVGALLAISTGSIWWAQTGRHLVLPRRTRL